MAESFGGGEYKEHEDDARICELNDQLRRTLSGGNILLTRGVGALSGDIQARALDAIRTFDEFTTDNDPNGHHDFGSVSIDDHCIWFKVDCYDNDLRYASPDPTNPELTTRVMTVLLPEEY